MQQTINDRIKEIATKLYNNNVNELCRAIGVKQATMSNIVAGRMSKPSFEVIAHIVENTSVSPLWLITGKGDMINESNNDAPAKPYEDSYGRLLSIVESQQRVIELQASTIEALSKK